MSLEIDPTPPPDDIARVLAQCYRLAAQRGREIRQTRSPNNNGGATDAAIQPIEGTPACTTQTTPDHDKL